MTRHPYLVAVAVTFGAVVAVLAALSAVAAHHVLNPDGWTEAKFEAAVRAVFEESA